MAKVYGYSRFSEARQLFGKSIQRQKSLIKEWLQKPENQGHILAEEINDYGISAYTGKNLDPRKSNLGKFLERLNNGEIEEGSFLLCEKLDRLGRIDYQDLWDVFRSIVKNGVKIVILDQGRTIDQENIKDFGLMITVCAQFYAANNESEKKSERLKKTWTYKREALEKGYKLTSSCPAWLKPITETIGGDRKITYSYEIIEEKANKIKQVYELYQTGMSVRSLTAYLNENIEPITIQRMSHEYDEQTQKAVKKPGNKPKWSLSYVSKLLQDRRVLGEYSPRQKGSVVYQVIDNYYPPILDQQTFESVQFKLRTARRTRSQNRQHINLLSGLLYDIDGGTYQQVRTTHGNHVSKRLYHYSHIQTPTTKKQHFSLDYEKFLFVVLQGLNLPSLETDNIAHQEKQKVILRDKIEQIEQGLKEASNTKTMLMLVKELDNLNGQLEELNRSERLPTEEELDFLRNLNDQLSEDKLLRLSILLPTIIRKIVIKTLQIKRATRRKTQKNVSCAVGHIFFIDGSSSFMLYWPNKIRLEENKKSYLSSRAQVGNKTIMSVCNHGWTVCRSKANQLILMEEKDYELAFKGVEFSGDTNIVSNRPLKAASFVARDLKNPDFLQSLITIQKNNKHLLG